MTESKPSPKPLFPATMEGRVRLNEKGFIAYKSPEDNPCEPPQWVDVKACWTQDGRLLVTRTDNGRRTHLAPQHLYQRAKTVYRVVAKHRQTFETRKEAEMAKTYYDNQLDFTIEEIEVDDDE